MLDSQIDEVPGHTDLGHNLETMLDESVAHKYLKFRIRFATRQYALL
jgi:hypothetical protein